MPFLYFALNGGTGTAADIPFETGDPVTFPAAPVREGYIFTGWDGYAPGFSCRWFEGGKTFKAGWAAAAESAAVKGGIPLIAAAGAVIFILPMDAASVSLLRHTILSRSLLAFNTNKENALFRTGDDIQFHHIFSGYIADVKLRSKQGPVPTQIDFQYTAWEAADGLYTGNVYPLSSMIGNPEAKVLCPYEDVSVALFTASNADADITRKTVYKNGSAVSVKDTIDPYGYSFFAADVFYNPLGIRPPIGIIYERSSKALLNVNAVYHPVIESVSSSLADSASQQFIIYENRYAIAGEEIYAVDDVNGAETFRLVNSNIGGLKYLGSSSSEAYFYSDTLDRILLFTGSGTIVIGELISRFGKVNKAYWSSLRNKIAIDITTQYEQTNKVLWRSTEGYEYQLHLTPDDNNLQVIDGNEGLIFQNPDFSNLFYFSIQEKPVYQEIIAYRIANKDKVEENRYTGYKQNPLRLKTSFLGQSPTVEMNVDKFIIVFYKTVLYTTANGELSDLPEKSARVEVQAFTFDQGRFFPNKKETVTLPPPSKWEASTFIYNYHPKYNSGVSFSLDIYSEDIVSIIGLAVDIQPDRNPTAGTVQNVSRVTH